MVKFAIILMLQFVKFELAVHYVLKVGRNLPPARRCVTLNKSHDLVKINNESAMFCEPENAKFTHSYTQLFTVNISMSSSSAYIRSRVPLQIPQMHKGGPLRRVYMC